MTVQQPFQELLLVLLGGLERSSRLNWTNSSVEPVSCSLVDFLVSTFALFALLLT